MGLPNTVKEISYYDVGQRITEARLAKGVSSTDMAAVLDISRENYSRAEHGTLPLKLEKMYLISQNLEVSLDYLLTGNDGVNMDTRFVKLLAGKSKKEIDRAYKMLMLLFEK